VLALVGEPLPFIGATFALVGKSLPLVGGALAFRGALVTLIGQPIPFVDPTLSPRQLFPHVIETHIDHPEASLLVSAPSDVTPPGPPSEQALSSSQYDAWETSITEACWPPERDRVSFADR
jgi:hypothetical protein